MLQVQNQTPFQCSLGVFADPQGVECAFGVVKATFLMDPRGCIPAPEQQPVIVADEYHDQPGNSALRRAAELTLSKPATDVLLSGHAHALGGPVTALDVTLRVGSLERTVRVIGERCWQQTGGQWRTSPPEPFETLPLVWERAYGGTDHRPKRPERPDYEPRNPVGRGLVARDSQTPVEGLALPNLEDPRDLIVRPGQRPTPVCFAPVAPHWQPRLSHAGTYDDAWATQRAPYLPDDFDPRFLQCAPPEQTVSPYLRGGEPVEIHGASPRGALSFRLPRCTLALVFDFDGRRIRHDPVLDTVHFEPDAERLTLVWRAVQPVDKKLLRLKRLGVFCKEYRKAEAAS